MRQKVVIVPVMLSPAHVDMSPRLFFSCNGKIYPLPRPPVLLRGIAEAIPSSVRGGEASPEQSEGSRRVRINIKE